MGNQEYMKKAMDLLSSGLASIDNDISWQNYLTFTSRFYNYSYNNIILIMMQRPDASFVAGYSTWKKMGRFVKKGSKAINIICPCIRKVETLKEPLDTSVYNDKEAEKEIKNIVSGFRIGKVFALEDTSGDDSLLPVLVTGLLGNDDEEQSLYESLLSYVSKEYCVQEVDCGSAKGSYNLENNVISINKNIEYRQKIKTLLHEYAHALDFEMNPDESIARNIRELRAESISYVVSLRLGVDTSSYSFSYLKSWLKEPEELKEIANCVQKISYQIISGLAGCNNPAFLNLKED